ncbi:GntR family transcriptional regulator [Coprobacillaceae bacterium CR2/5/TPMF4]|nr:GntR family transcriptional regulator [Coprobacillaceae bacterium CR2/5/TPMF4]
MEIILSNASSKPIYEQIALQIKEHIMKGELKANDPLPSMRKLAKDLHVSIITTQRAYEELSKDGFIDIVPAKGAFVSIQNKDFIIEENRQRIEKLLSDACELAKQNGITVEELLQTLQLIFKGCSYGIRY